MTGIIDTRIAFEQTNQSFQPTTRCDTDFS